MPSPAPGGNGGNGGNRVVQLANGDPSPPGENGGNVGNGEKGVVQLGDPLSLVELV